MPSAHLKLSRFLSVPTLKPIVGFYSSLFDFSGIGKGRQTEASGEFAPYATAVRRSVHFGLLYSFFTPTFSLLVP